MIAVTKQIPNILTVLRIVLCVPLLLARPVSPVFAALYISCGLSDVLDGFLARRLGAVSKIGAMLDSIADAIFFFVIIAKFMPIIKLPQWLLFWIAAIVGIKLISLAVGYRKYHALAFLHTYANKATGLLLFCFPLFFNINIAVVSAIMCALASLAALEELIINILSPQLARDIKSVLKV